jgi:chemotaxis-related protein WspD
MTARNVTPELLESEHETGECRNRIGVGGDRSCRELEVHIHCHNCPVYTATARTFFDRQAPAGYLEEWTKWLAESRPTAAQAEKISSGHSSAVTPSSTVSVLIFQLGPEWLAVRTQAIAEVSTPRPIHRVPHRSSDVFRGLVNLRGELALCVSLHGLLGIASPGNPSHLIVLRDTERRETWAFEADGVPGVDRVPTEQYRAVPSTLISPSAGFSQAVLSWQERSIGLLDDRRVVDALRSLWQ